MCDSPHEICWEHFLVFLSLLNIINMVSREFLMVRVWSLNISKKLELHTPMWLIHNNAPLNSEQIGAKC